MLNLYIIVLLDTITSNEHLFILW